MRLIAMFNLKPDVSVADYEEWAGTRLMPGVRSLVSVKDFSVYRTTGVLHADTQPPFQYIELLDITHIDDLDKDWRSEIIDALTAEMQAYADDVAFVTTELLMA